MDLFEGTPDARQGQTSETDSPFRKRYRQLNEQEIEVHDRIKNLASELHFVFSYHVKPSRETSLAKTKLEEAVMWAVKGLTA
jgi:hypothetical protein